MAENALSNNGKLKIEENYHHQAIFQVFMKSKMKLLGNRANRLTFPSNAAKCIKICCIIKVVLSSIVLNFCGK